MSSSILTAKPEEMNNREKRGAYTVVIVGCEPTSILHACLFAEAGFKVVCADADQTITNLLAKGRAPFVNQETEAKLKNHVKMGNLRTTRDIKTAVSKSDAIIISVPVKISEKKKPDCSDLERTCKLVGSSLQRGSLVVIMNVTRLDAVEGTLKEILENTAGLKIGTDFGLAYSPVHGLREQTLEEIAGHHRTVAAADETSLNAASVLFEAISKRDLARTRNVKVAEMAALFEATYQDVNVALANELAVFCEKAGVDCFEVQKLVRTDAFGKLSLPALVDRNPLEPTYILLEDAENLNVKLRIASVTKEIGGETVKHASSLVSDALKACGKTMRRARVSVLGATQVPNVKSPFKRMVREFVRLLEAKGSRVSLFDPYFPDAESTEMQRYFRKSLTEAVEGADCIVIMTAHDQFKRLNLRRLKALMKMPAVIADFDGCFEPDKVEKEGFTYRGLGRGVWTK